MTETVIKARMMAELMFDTPEARDLAIGKLTERGFEIRRLDDWRDEGGTPTTWILALIDYEGDPDEFCDEVESIVDSTECEVLEAGYSGSDADVEAWIAKKS
jgi:hypothetical protein